MGDEYYAGRDGDEVFNCHHKNKESAVLECIQYYNIGIGEEVLVGKIDVFKPKIDINDIIDQQLSDACDSAGESSDSWLVSVQKESYSELEEKLNQVFLDWLEDKGETPGFGPIATEEPIIVTQKHLDDLK